MSADDEQPDDVDSEEVEAEAEAEADAEAPAVVARDETAELRSSEARRKLRNQMQADIERFLKSGGRIEHVEPSVSGPATNPAGTNDTAT